MSDPKYDGIRTSRRQLYEDDDAASEDEGADDESMVNDEEQELSEGATDDDEELRSPVEDGVSQDESGSASDDETPQSRSQAARRQVSEASAGLSRIDLGRSETPADQPGDSQPEGDIAANLRITHEADRRKGKAVSRQIVSSPSMFSNVASSVGCTGFVGYATRCTHTATKSRNGCKPASYRGFISICLYPTHVHAACSPTSRRSMLRMQVLARQ